MPKAPFTTTACLVAALCVLPAQAADTPSNMPEPQAAPVADPLRPARDAIGARHWDQALVLLPLFQHEGTSPVRIAVRKGLVLRLDVFG